MLTLFKTLFSPRSERSIATLERAYLDAAVSRYDLERREREIERGLFRLGAFAV